MNSSKRELIIQRALVLLNSATPAGVPQTTRTRQRAISKASMPDISLFPVQDSTLSLFPRGARGQEPGAPRNVQPGMAVQKDLDMAVECAAAGTLDPSTGDVLTTPDQEVDPLTTWAEQALCGGGVDWQGLAIRATALGTTFEYNTAESAFCKATVQIRITYLSEAGDPTAT